MSTKTPKTRRSTPKPNPNRRVKVIGLRITLLELAALLQRTADGESLSAYIRGELGLPKKKPGAASPEEGA